MQVYMVGGAVRDQLLGLPIRDRDWVVVGSHAAEMVAAGYQPVGRDFPVFLHPRTHEEYALARTERKTAAGYHGFQFHASPEVTLEQDLARRDLTINAMAQATDGSVIDPYGGQTDLAAGCLRHVSPAFAEDPVRILRVARFAARFGFHVAPETLDLMQKMVQAGEVDALVPERVWQEIARGLQEPKPSVMFEVLRQCGALARILPEVDRLFGVPQRADYHPEIDTGIHTMMVIDVAAQQQRSLATRFAALCHDLGKGLTPPNQLPRHEGHEARGIRPTTELCQRLNVPAECRELALLTCEYHTHVHRAKELRAETVLKLFRSCDALRRPQRFLELLHACEADSQGRLGFTEQAYPQAAYLTRLLTAARSVDAGAIAQQCSNPKQISQQVDAARINYIQQTKQHLLAV